MKKNIIFSIGLGTIMASAAISCKKSSFDDNYRDPSKVVSTTVEKQFTGIIYANKDLCVPSYDNYFVILRTTAIRYVQATGWANEINQYVTGAAAIGDRWTRYYQTLAQFRQLQKVYAALSTEDQDNYKIFMDAAKIFFYDQTQQTVDLHGAIPWSKAGMLDTNNGDYTTSYAAYDNAEDIYTTMLDDLKSISTELNNITVPSALTAAFATQDLINNGNVDLWKKYCNSLRLRMLTRVSAASAFSSRSSQEIGDIINNPSTYPIILDNADNAQIDIFSTGSDINSTGFKDGIESAGGWYSNVASKAIVDLLQNNSDPRLPYLLQPGDSAKGVYSGLDQSLTASVQTNLMSNGKVAIYNRSTFSRNGYFPGILISAAEVNFLVAEYFVKHNNNASAKTYFENGVKQSIAMYQSIRAGSNDNSVTAPTVPTSTAINTLLTKLNWDNTTNKQQLISTQKWLHFNLVQPLESWAEIRRTGYPILTFPVQNTDIQKTVPLKWVLPSEESQYNATNYAAVKAQDDANTPLFWDVN